MDEASKHIPVLLSEVTGQMKAEPGMTVLDGTLGLGGHACAIIEQMSSSNASADATFEAHTSGAEATCAGNTSGEGGASGGGVYVGLDRDAGQVERARARLESVAAAHGVRLELHQGDFAQAREILDRVGIAKVDRLLADLGFASNQVDEPSRGLSFKADGPLDMRLDPSGGPTAADLVAELDERGLADVLYEYGEERLSRKIARKIVAERAREPIRTTRHLAEIVRLAHGPRGRSLRIDPATRTFQALRIAVNRELDALDRLLRGLPDLVSSSGLAGIISFHSLEDRRVKHAFLDMESQGAGSRITRKPIIASETEIAHNPRSRSAKLRVFAMA